MLGIREPSIYGTATYQDLEQLVAQSCESFSYDMIQSNHEGVLVDTIQGALGQYDGIIINPAAYTHTSIALLDAVKAVGIPTVEVHLSDVSTREDFRQVSYVGMACVKTVMGKGIDGYREAIEYFKNNKNNK